MSGIYSRSEFVTDRGGGYYANYRYPDTKG